MSRIFAIRHGITDWNKQELIQGATDIPLAEEGRAAAKKIAAEIDLGLYDAIYASPMKRAYETAEIIVDGRRKIQTDSRLVERKFGDYEGEKIEFGIIEKMWNYSIDSGELGMERLSELLSRVSDFVEDVKIKHPNQDVLIITHACVIKALYHVIKGYDENTDFLEFMPENTKIYEYKLD